MRTCVLAHVYACVCICARFTESAHNAFLILGNQKQIIGKKHMHCLREIGRRWRQEIKQVRRRHSKKKAREEDRRTAGKEGAPEKATERGQDKVRMRWREVKKRGREDNKREAKEEDRDDMEEEGRVGGERAEEFPCPVQRKWA